jgi:hypothetical protein
MPPTLNPQPNLSPVLHFKLKFGDNQDIVMPLDNAAEFAFSALSTSSEPAVRQEAWSFLKACCGAVSSLDSCNMQSLLVRLNECDYKRTPAPAPNPQHVAFTRKLCLALYTALVDPALMADAADFVPKFMERSLILTLLRFADPQLPQTVKPQLQPAAKQPFVAKVSEGERESV